MPSSSFCPKVYFGKSREQLLNILSDWFDKVRIGLWLAYNQFFDRNYWGVNPNFYIADRIGTSDRAILIYRVAPPQKRVNFVGMNTPAFAHSPTCFGLLINDLYFVNVSTDFLVTKRAGLPYPKSISTRWDDRLLVTVPFLTGSEELRFPILDLGQDKRCVVIAQPIFEKYLPLSQESYESEYVKAITLISGRAKPILQKSNFVMVYPSDESLDWLPTHKHDLMELFYSVAIQTLRIQITLLSRIHMSKEGSKDQKQPMKFTISQCKKANRMLIGILEKDMASGG